MIKETPEYIYLIRCEDSDFYKIGITNNLEKRRGELQTGCLYELEYAYWIRYDNNTNVADIEFYTHNEMLNCRVRGEWYKLSEKDAHQLAGRLAHPINQNNKAVECNWDADGWTTATHTSKGDIYGFA